uniref:Uncharacterized protein n=1 Tax=Meloidogyne enterolobii TaxID=390850 RepID=A0A6V7TXL1_MELEN|nr:unnamed protein product [Meloidogyne enterolobii]
MAKFLLILVIVAVYIHLCNSGKNNEINESKAKNPLSVKAGPKFKGGSNLKIIIPKAINNENSVYKNMVSIKKTFFKLFPALLFL